MAKQNKRVFTIKEGTPPVEITLEAIKPDSKIRRQGDILYNKTFAEHVKGGSLVKAAVEKVMREQGLWDDSREAEFQRLRKALEEGEKKLARGRMKLSEAREVALKMADDRQALLDLLGERSRLDLNTAEAQAENARFNFLVSACVFYGHGSDKFGKPYFKDMEDYIARSEETSVMEIAGEVGKLLYGLDDEFIKKRPEVAFLLKQKMVDEKFRLIGRDGKRCDRKGRPVDEEGRLVNDKGQLVDEDGFLVNEEGYYVVESEEFEDDIGWHAV